MFTTDDANTLSRLIADPDMAVDPAWVEGVLREHPAFAFAAALLLARNPESIDADTRKDMQAALMLNSSDHAAMADLSDLAGSKWATYVEHPEKKAQKSTADTIDTFLGTFSNSTPEEDALLERLIMNPVGEYQLEPEPQAESQEYGEAEPQGGDISQPTPPPFVPPVPAEAEKAETEPAPSSRNHESTLMMESLAKIFIKQRRYERAFVIINNLILKYPEKSVYFADQLRFLQKLIINSKYKTK